MENKNRLKIWKIYSLNLRSLKDFTFKLKGKFKFPHFGKYLKKMAKSIHFETLWNS